MFGSQPAHTPISNGPPPGGGPHGTSRAFSGQSIAGSMCPGCGSPMDGHGGTCPGCGVAMAGSNGIPPSAMPMSGPGMPAGAAPPMPGGGPPPAPMHGTPRKSADSPGFAPQAAPLAPGIRMPGKANPIMNGKKPTNHNPPRR